MNKKLEVDCSDHKCEGWINLKRFINKLIKIHEGFFCWILPAGEIYYELEIVKKRIDN